MHAERERVSRLVGPSGGSGSISIQTARECSWSVSASSSWVSLGGAASGQGEAVVPYTVAANPAPLPRTASLTVGTEQVALNQAPASCTFKLSGPHDTIGAAGGVLSVGVATLSGCGWTAASTAPWIGITSGQSGSATGTVALTVAANSAGARVGSVNIAGQTYTVAQDGAVAAPPSPAPAPAPTPSPSPAPHVTVSGANYRHGPMSDLTFTMPGEVQVTTSRDTNFDAGKCGNVKPGHLVTVQGTPGSNGVIAADVVKFDE